MSSSLKDLRDDLERVRATQPRRSSEAREAFERLFRASAKKGQPLDALRRYTADETERFFAQTVTGVSGHVYWDGSRNGFVRNDKKSRAPRRWWWAHKHGKEPGQYEDIVAMCGELNCINPEHCEMGRNLRRPKRYTEEQMLNAIKVAALRLGHPPSTLEWSAMKGSPDRKIFQACFGNWGNAVRKAGFAEYGNSGRKAA